MVEKSVHEKSYIRRNDLNNHFRENSRLMNKTQNKSSDVYKNITDRIISENETVN